MELVRFEGAGSSVVVRVTGWEDGWFDGEIVVRSGFVEGSVRVGGNEEDLEEWGALLDVLEDEEAYEDEDGEVFAGDWPREGRTAYLRVVAEDPLVVEVRDAPGTGICVRVPFEVGDGWVAEARERLGALSVGGSTLG
ncbi:MULTISPECIES: DUF5959 family protein [unclassified Streptomyces]|uniref:DUF5959 family protein n=1 Tax=Streptomyces niveiscabiei TaxID=164115 RepID=A0ABW9HY23_9ACTN|nr:MULTISPECIES: DUF5959 family protein [unclassified Streptomyces]QZZ28803.1 hypothetical protein A7X85_23355 [Streptomyces sp. ST1015]